MPVTEKLAQAGQVSEPYSTSLIGALGLPASQPPSGVMATTSFHCWPAGAATGATTVAVGMPSSPDPQAARPSASEAAQAGHRSGSLAQVEEARRWLRAVEARRAGFHS